MGKQFAGRIIADGRVTVPSHIRDELDLERGDYVTLEIEGLNG